MENGNKIWLMIFEKGRFAQWLGILMCTIIALCGGFGGFLAAAQIVQIVFAGVGLAGGVEIIRKIGKDD